MAGIERKTFTQPLRRIIGEWKYRTPALSIGIAALSSEQVSFRIGLVNVLVAGGIGFAVGFLLDRHERGDSQRMREWLRSAKRFKS